MAFTPHEAYERLKRAFEEGRLAHAYLITGTRREDLIELAVKLVNLVNGWKCPDMEAIALKGVPVVEPESKLRQIKIKMMRELEHRFHVSSDYDWKVGVVIDAERQTPEAANAFLKTLEEPPPQSLILELSTNPEAMLDTVRSRCIRVPLFEPGQKAMELTEPQAKLATAVGKYFLGDRNSHRAMGLLREFQSLLVATREKLSRDNTSAYKAEVEEYGQSTDGTWLKDREDYWTNVTESEYIAARSGMIGILHAWIGETLKRKAGAASAYLPDQTAAMDFLASQVDFNDLQRRLKAIDDLRNTLATNVREGLAMEVYLVKAFC